MKQIDFSSALWRPKHVLTVSSSHLSPCLPVCLVLCMFVFLFLCLSVCQVAKPAINYSTRSSIKHAWQGYYICYCSTCRVKRLFFFFFFFCINFISMKIVFPWRIKFLAFGAAKTAEESLLFCIIGL